MATNDGRAGTNLMEIDNGWWARQRLLKVLKENAELRKRLAEAKGVLSHSLEAFLADGPLRLDPPQTIGPPTVAHIPAVRRAADNPAQPEKRQKL